MVNRLLFAVFVLLTGFLAGGFFLPDRYHVERSIYVEQAPPMVFSLLNNYRTFNEWSPWAGRDPAAKFTISGAASGLGARLDWSGDPRLIGKGWQEITESRPYERIGMHLDFSEQGTAKSYFQVEAKGDGSNLTWGFDTDVTERKGMFGALLGRYFGLFLNRWIGTDYEQGLQAFKRYAEALPSVDFSRSEIEIVDIQPRNILYVSGSTSQEAGDVAEALAAAFGEITAFLAESGLERSGQPMAITRGWDEQGFRFDAALPVDRLPRTTSGNVQKGLSPAGRAVRYIHRGPYDRMLDAYDRLASFMAANGLEEGPVSWELYVSDPGSTPEDEIITHIYFLIAE